MSRMNLEARKTLRVTWGHIKDWAGGWGVPGRGETIRASIHLGTVID